MFVIAISIAESREKLVCIQMKGISAVILFLIAEPIFEYSSDLWV
jgi:hypothetical protein